MDAELRDSARRFRSSPRDPISCREYLSALERADPWTRISVLSALRVSDETTWTEPALIVGEAGTRIASVARALHERRGSAGPFVSFDARGLARSFLQAALFGRIASHEPRASLLGGGLLHGATNGSALIEFETLPGEVVDRLLGFAEQNGVRLVIAASPTAARALPGTLLDRLVHRIELPPVRERVDDLALLVEHAAPGLKLEDTALDALTRYGWPGNDAELEAEMGYLAQRHRGEPVARRSLPAKMLVEILDRRAELGGIYRVGPAPERDIDQGRHV